MFGPRKLKRATGAPPLFRMTADDYAREYARHLKQLTQQRQESAIDECMRLVDHMGRCVAVFATVIAIGTFGPELDPHSRAFAWVLFLVAALVFVAGVSLTSAAVAVWLNKNLPLRPWLFGLVGTPVVLAMLLIAGAGALATASAYRNTKTAEAGARAGTTQHSGAPAPSGTHR